MSLPPDVATVTIQFTAKGRTPRLASRIAVQRANAIREALVAVGIPKDSMPTGGNWGYWGARSDMSVGPSMYDTAYVSHDVFTVRVRNLDLLGRVVDTALVQGAQTISGVQFGATNTSGAHVSALREATRQASANAEVIAEASGGRLGRLVELTTEPRGGYYDPRTFRLEEIVSTGLAGSASVPTIMAPQLRLTVTVHGRWSVEPRP